MSLETDPEYIHVESRERERFVTDKVANVEGVVVGPEGVVDAGVPAAVGADDVVGGKEGRKG